MDMKFLNTSPIVMKDICGKAMVMLCVVVITAGSQISAVENDELFTMLKAKDEQLFTVGINACAIEKMSHLISEDIVFYHDRDGITESKASLIDSINQGICGAPVKILRRLVPDTLAVYPLYDRGELYGAVQTGQHEFYTDVSAGPAENISAKFTHLWLFNGEGWVLSQVLSYDHQE